MSRPRVVVLRALNLGDLLTGVPALRAVRRHYPDHHLTLVAPSRFRRLILREGLADEISDSHELAALDPALAGAEVAVDLHGRGPGSQPLLLALRPRRLIAFAHPQVPATTGLPDWRPGEHEVQRWCRLLRESGIDADPGALDITVPPLAFPEASGATVIHPGAAAPGRRWPAERFATVARSEADRGRPVFITGGAGERPLADEVVQQAAEIGVQSIAGQTDLDGLISVIGSAARVISGDTGVAHIAFAVGTPSVTLYGPVPPSEWGPPPGRSQHRTLWAGRRGDPHATQLDPGLAAIQPDDVRAELVELDRLTEPARGRAGAPV